MTDQPTLTVVEAAKRLDVQPAVVRRWIAEWKVAATKAGRSHRTSAGDVERVKEGSRPVYHRPSWAAALDTPCSAARLLRYPCDGLVMPL